MKRITFLLVLLAACAPQEAVDLSEYKCPDCNVILISIDTFRGDHLTCAGYNKYDVDITKNICGFATEGILFTNTISQAPSTQPSHASILTSAIPSHHQSFTTRNQSHSKEYLLLSEVLGQEKFHTAGFTGSSQVSAIYGFDKGFDKFEEFTDEDFRKITEEGLAWLKNNSSPFFLFLHTYEIHHPYTPRIEYVQELNESYNGTIGTNITIGFLKEINNKTKSITPEDLQHIISMYDAEILSVDRTFGWFIDQLKSIDKYNKTIIIFTSDHGEEFGEHGFVGWHANSLYNELLRVPLILHAPGLTPGVKTHLVRSIDIAPTLLDMLNIIRPATYEGRSLAEINEYAISERDSPYPVPFTIQTPEMKYYWAKSFSRLFNLTRDPAEQKNVPDNSIAKKLSAIYTEQVNKTKSTGTNVTVPKELREQLKALGYVG